MVASVKGFEDARGGEGRGRSGGDGRRTGLESIPASRASERT
jgi:hypothetical protein